MLATLHAAALAAQEACDITRPADEVCEAFCTSQVRIVSFLAHLAHFCAIL